MVIICSCPFLKISWSIRTQTTQFTFAHHREFIAVRRRAYQVMESRLIHVPICLLVSSYPNDCTIFQRYCDVLSHYFFKNIWHRGFSTVSDVAKWCSFCSKETHLYINLRRWRDCLRSWVRWFVCVEFAWFDSFSSLWAAFTLCT